MSGFLQPIIDEVTRWEDMSYGPHQFNAVEFMLNLNDKKIEIGHLHSGRLLDILFSTKIRDVLIAEGKTKAHHILPETGWTSRSLHNDADLAEALWLLRLSYLQKRSKEQKNSHFEAEINALGLSEALRSAAFPRLSQPGD